MEENKGMVWFPGTGFEGTYLEGSLILRRVVIQNLKVKVFLEKIIDDGEWVTSVDFWGTMS